MICNNGFSSHKIFKFTQLKVHEIGKTNLLDISMIVVLRIQTSQASLKGSFQLFRVFPADLPIVD